MKNFRKAARGTLNYIKKDLREIVLPRPLDNPPDYRPLRKLTWKEEWKVSLSTCNQDFSKVQSKVNPSFQSRHRPGRGCESVKVTGIVLQALCQGTNFYLDTWRSPKRQQGGGSKEAHQEPKRGKSQEELSLMEEISRTLLHTETFWTE